MSLAATVGRVSELCNCRWANERGVHGACVLPVTSREPARSPVGSPPTTSPETSWSARLTTPQRTQNEQCVPQNGRRFVYGRCGKKKKCNRRTAGCQWKTESVLSRGQDDGVRTEKWILCWWCWWWFVPQAAARRGGFFSRGDASGGRLQEEEMRRPIRQLGIFRQVCVGLLTLFVCFWGSFSSSGKTQNWNVASGCENFRVSPDAFCLNNADYSLVGCLWDNQFFPIIRL